MDQGTNLSPAKREQTTSAEECFVRTYSEGIRFYVQRHAGDHDLERRVEQTLSSMRERVRHGWKPDAPAVHAYLRELSPKWPRGPGKEQTPSAHSRIQAKVEALKDALRDCSRRELELLIHYYCNSQNLADVAAEMNMDEGEARRLRERLRKIAMRASPPEPLNSCAGAA